MKLVIVAVLAVVGIAVAAPQNKQPSEQVQILKSSYDQQPEGPYNYGYETSDGTKQEATGELKSVVDEENKPQDVVVIRGSYSYNDPEGKPHSFTYFADETGFHVEGEDVPKAQ